MRRLATEHLRETPIVDRMRRLIDLARSARSLATGGRDRRNRRGAGLVLYHGVSPRLEDPFVEAAHIGASLFRAQVRHLKKHYAIVSLDDVVEAIGGGEPLPNDWVVLTFDDGYANNLSCAREILREEGDLPMTLYLATDMIGSKTTIPTVHAKMLIMHTRRRKLTLPNADDEWNEVALPGRAARANVFWRLHASLRASTPTRQEEVLARILEEIGGDEAASIRTRFASFDWLDWDGVRELHRDGVTIANHTRSHVSMRDELGRERIEEELDGAHAKIEAETGVAPAHFAYPYGGPDDVGLATVELLRARGYRSAVTTWAGTVDRNASPLELRRLVGCVNEMGRFRRALATGQGGPLDAA